MYNNKSFQLLLTDRQGKIDAIEKLPALTEAYQEFSMCSFADRFAFVSGGIDIHGRLYNSVYRYDFSKKKRVRMPGMTTPRFLHASCALRNAAIYVFGGFGKPYRLLDSIERMVNPGSKKSASSWELLNVCLTLGRICAKVSALNANEIIIFGGMSCKGKEIVDANILDTRTMAVTDHADVVEERFKVKIAR